MDKKNKKIKNESYYSEIPNKQNKSTISGKFYL